jgi:hypothetical protein
MAKGKTRMAAGKHHGIPRTSKVANALGLKKVRVNFKKMDDAEKKNWIHISSRGVRHGALGSVRIGPSNEPGMVIACYYEESTGEYTHCVKVPAGSVGLPPA